MQLVYVACSSLLDTRIRICPLVPQYPSGIPPDSLTIASPFMSFKSKDEMSKMDRGRYLL